MEIKMMTVVEQDELRRSNLNEVGTEPPCPWCGRSRVKRSDYTRCNPCGTNWLVGEDLTRDPMMSRTRNTAQVRMETKDGAQTAKSTTEA